MVQQQKGKYTVRFVIFCISLEVYSLEKSIETERERTGEED